MLLIYRQASIIKDCLRGYAHCETVLRTDEPEKKGKATHRATLLALIVIFLPSCGGGSQDAPSEPREEGKGVKMEITITSAIIPGIRQFYSGRILAGILWLIITPGLWIGTGGLLGWTAHVVSAYTAYAYACDHRMRT